MRHRHSLTAPALAVALLASVPQPARAASSGQVPDAIQAPAGHQAFLGARAYGTQNYMCLPSTPGVAWTLVGPQATLFDGSQRQVITHFLSVNPFEFATGRAAWQHSADSSSIWGRAVASSADPAFVAAGAIPWLLLEIVGAQPGPDGRGTLSEATFIQRVNTVGGVAPAAGCAVSTDVGKRVFVPYEADYVFFTAR
jgi:hypothetical protein